MVRGENSKLPERLERLPLRVQLHLGSYRGARCRSYRVACFRAESTRRTLAWEATQIYGRTIGVAEGPRYSGWRKAHMRGFHIWWASDLEDLAALAAISVDTKDKKDRRARRKERAS